MNERDFNKYTLKDEHCTIDWERQRVQINERIDRAQPATFPIWRWVTAVAATAAIALMVWFGTQHTAYDGIDYAALEQEIDEIIEGREPASLMVLNSWTDVDIADWQTIPATFETYEEILIPTNETNPETNGVKEVL